jgi:hypothetical protein
LAGGESITQIIDKEVDVAAGDRTGKDGKFPGGYRLRITIREVKPPVGRLIVVRGDITLTGFHRVIQAVMGWADYHLYLFRFGEREYGLPDDEFPSETRYERGRKLREFLLEERQSFVYEYDFGDDWKHDVLLEKIHPGPDVPYAECLDGARSCPPEDVGGPWGYEKFLKAFRDPSHSDHEQMARWAGRSFDPERFDLPSINFRLGLMARRRRPGRGGGTGKEEKVH